MYICTQCADVTATRQCRVHPDDVALSIDDPAVVEELGRLDVEAWEKFAHKYELAGFAVAFLIGIVPAAGVLGAIFWAAARSMEATSTVIIPTPKTLLVPLLLCGVILYAFGRFGLRLGTRFAASRFEPRFTRWNIAGRERIAVALRF